MSRLKRVLTALANKLESRAAWSGGYAYTDEQRLTMEMEDKVKEAYQAIAADIRDALSDLDE